MLTSVPTVISYVFNRALLHQRFSKVTSTPERSMITLSYRLRIEREFLYWNQHKKLNKNPYFFSKKRLLKYKRIFFKFPKVIMCKQIESDCSPSVGIFLVTNVFEVMFIFNLQAIIIFEALEMLIYNAIKKIIYF